MANLLTGGSQAATTPAGGIFARLRNAVLERQRRRQEREIGRFVCEHGCALTDEVEREIGLRFGSPQ